MNLLGFPEQTAPQINVIYLEHFCSSVMITVRLVISH